MLIILCKFAKFTYTNKKRKTKREKWHASPLTPVIDSLLSLECCCKRRPFNMVHFENIINERKEHMLSDVLHKQRTYSTSYSVLLIIRYVASRNSHNMLVHLYITYLYPHFLCDSVAIELCALE